MFLIVVKIDGIIEEKNESNYLIFDLMQLHSKNENKEVLKKSVELWDGIKRTKDYYENDKERLRE